MNQNNSQNNLGKNNMNKQNQSNQKNKQNDINYKVIKNQSAMDLENLNLEYKSQLTAYRQAVSNYVNFLQNNKGLTYLIIGLKNDGRLYSSKTLEGEWVLIEDDSYGLKSICTGNDGKMLIISDSNNNIFTKPTWNSEKWEGPITDPCCVLSVAMGKDGTLVGVGMDNRLWSKSTLNGSWSLTTSAEAGEFCLSVCIAPDDSIYVIGANNHIYKKPSYKTLTTTSWEDLGNNTCCVIAITIAPDGTLLGIGTNGKLYSMDNYQDIKNLTWKGEYANSSDFIGITTVTSNKKDDSLTSIQGQTFWGTGQAGSQSVYTGGDLEQCKALCAKTSDCTGATFNPSGHEQPMCWLRTGEGDLAKGLDTDYAIVPEAKQYLMVIESINKKLLETNNKIKETTKKAEPEYNMLKQQNKSQDNVLKQNYLHLNIERKKIKSLLDQYENLDKNETQGTLKIYQKYYTFILLLIIAIGIIILFYKFSGMFTSAQNNSPTSSYIQQGGELPPSTYMFVLIIIIAIILVNYFTDITNTATSIGNGISNGFSSVFGSFGNLFYID
jgi:hypothetical protein